MKATLFLILFAISIWTRVWCINKANPVEEYSDHKDFKQLLRTRTNVLVLFTAAKSVSKHIHNVFREAAKELRGVGTLLSVDCSGRGQKLCRQLKASPNPHAIHHYKDGKFHKQYDRHETVKSIVRFMNDPTGDVPWEEEPNGKNVIHLDNPKILDKLLKKHNSVLVMFYAPWCVYCKQLKPEYSAAAKIVRSNGFGVLAAMDVMRTENSEIRSIYNITSFPTILFFKDGDNSATYEGENKQNSIVEFMKNPQAPPPKVKEIPWSEEDSDVHHLTTDNFDLVLKEYPSVLVMFYAPWCGHCKKLKPEWMKAAAIISKLQLSAVLAAVDSTKETALSQLYKVSGYPTIKYFKDGEFAFDAADLRDTNKIVEFLKDPKEPPPVPPEPNWEDVPSEVIHLNEKNFNSQLRSKRHALVLFYAPWCGHCKAAKPEFESAAEKLKDQPRMVMAAVNCVENAGLCNEHKVIGYPTFKYFNYLKKSSSYSDGRTTKDFISFFQNLEPDAIAVIKTENIPSPVTDHAAENKKVKENTNQEAVNHPGWERLIHLSKKNYKDILFNNEHLYVLFYSKSCQNCYDVKIVMARIKSMLDPEETLVAIAACDADKYPSIVKELKVNSFPSVKYFRKARLVADFTGEYTVAEMKSFLNKSINQKDEL